jgi:hypothetical protein
METAYLICAIVGGTLITCQFLLTVLGLGGHHDTGGGHDVAGHDSGCHDAAGHDSSAHDGDHDQHGGGGASWFLSVLTFRTVTAGAALFGLTGLTLSKADAGEAISLGGAILAGLAAIFTVRWLMQSMAQLNVDGTLQIRKAVGASGVVYLSIPGGKTGSGKVHVTMGGRLVEYRAVTDKDDLPTGAKVVVVAVVDGDTVEVHPEPSSERVTHA